MKGRGTATNPANRFQHVQVVQNLEFAEPLEKSPDGVKPVAGPGQVEGPVATKVRPVRARTMLTENQSPDVPFELSVNPYQGCEHGCIYCYARPAHAYLDLSPGLDFETRIFAKTNAVEVLEEELRHPSYRCRPITIGANTDGYQPAEKRLRITRGILELCLRFRQPVSIVTKSALVERDIDLLSELAAGGLTSVAISLTSLDHRLKRTLEPRTAGPAARLRAMESLSLAGVPVSVLVAPVIPRINDSELEDLLRVAHQHGARSAAYIFLRLPLEVRDLFVDWLRQHYPDRAGAVMSLIRQSRGGRDYDSTYGTRMSGTGPFAALIARRFQNTCRKLGLGARSLALDTSQFLPPPRAGDQLRLF